MRTTAPMAVLVLAASAPSTILSAQRDASAPHRLIGLERLEGGSYHLIAPAEDPPERDRAREAAKDAAKGRGLLVVLPGGDGGWEDPAAFLPFVRNGLHARLPGGGRDFVTALGIARRWREDQKIVWPTRSSRVRGAEWRTETYVREVVADASARAGPIDPERIVLLGWSSSGPAVYETLLRKDRPTDRGYVAMSVFGPKRAALRYADDLRLVLDQSPEDRVTPLRFAEDARDRLTEKGAAVWLRRYAGGHGWQDRPLERFARGIEWLLGDDAPPADTPAAEDAPAEGRNLLENGGFEDGVRGWTVLDNSGRTEAEAAKTPADRRSEGSRSLHLAKTGGMPLDLVRQDVDLDGADEVTVSAWVAAEGASNAFLKFFAYDADGEAVAEDVDLLHVRGDREGGVVARTWKLGGRAKRGTVMLVMVLGGEVWLDDVRVVARR